MTTRRYRRLSLRQAIRCEVALQPLAGVPCRCRCAGRCRGASRVADSARPTRWDFAKLPADDPHHIPAQRRRISPRRAVQVITDAIKRKGGSARLAVAVAKLRERDRAAADTLMQALSAADRVVRDERRAAERRTMLWQLNHAHYFDADVFSNRVSARLAEWESREA